MEEWEDQEITVIVTRWSMAVQKKKPEVVKKKIVIVKRKKMIPIIAAVIEKKKTVIRQKITAIHVKKTSGKIVQLVWDMFHGNVFGC